MRRILLSLFTAIFLIASPCYAQIGGGAFGSQKAPLYEPVSLTSDITLENGEIISNTTNDQIDFKDDDGTVYASLTINGISTQESGERLYGLYSYIDLDDGNQGSVCQGGKSGSNNEALCEDYETDSNKVTRYSNTGVTVFQQKIKDYHIDDESENSRLYVDDAHINKSVYFRDGDMSIRQTEDYLILDGTGDFISRAAHADLAINNTLDQITVYAEVYVSDASNNDDHLFYHTNGTVGYYIDIDDEDVNNYRIRAKAEFGAGTDAQLLTSNRVLVSNSWAKVMLTYNEDSDNKWKCYIAGSLISTLTTDIAGVGTLGDDSALTFYFGSTGSAAEPIVNVRDIRVWNRALSSTEATQVAAGTPVTTNLVLWWKVDEGSGTSLTDSSGNGLTGTVTNATWNTRYLELDSNGQGAKFDDDIVSTSTGTIGWTVQSGADTACSTTCTYGCVFGFDEGAADAETIVDCSDATADKCVCAGAN